MKNGTACILRIGDEILFLNRCGGEKDIHNGFYVFPGGTIERGETGLENVRREFEEETGLELIFPKLKALWTCDNRDRLLGGRIDREDWLVQVYEADSYAGLLRKEKEKNANPVWIKNYNLGKIKMYPGDRKLIEILNKEGILEVNQRYAGEDLIRFSYARID